MNDQLFFSYTSPDHSVGKGENETIENTSEYKDLNMIVHWRKFLSNYHILPFVYQGKTYNTIQHALQSSKIALVDKEKAEWFTVESGNPIGQGDGYIARKNRKIVLLNKDVLSKWYDIKNKILVEILTQKFLQIHNAKRVLLATKKSKLFSKHKNNVCRQYELEKVRTLISLKDHEEKKRKEMK